MPPDRAYYLARADECAAEAEASPLENVKARCRRSEETWRGMADRLEKSEQMRAGRGGSARPVRRTIDLPNRGRYQAVP